MNAQRRRVAVIGVGMAGALCARLLVNAGHDVRLFDKSRGVGGRMATRRVEWTSDDGLQQRARLDHGAPFFGAQSPDFMRFVEGANRAGLLSHWVPRDAPGSIEPPDATTLWVPTPDMPALCRALLVDVPVHTGSTIDGLSREGTGWSLQSAGATVDEGFGVVIVAIPPRQAAPLVAPYRLDWSERAHALRMSPCWALMGITDETTAEPSWDIARPSSGALALIVRNDAKPARERVPRIAQWVVHATSAWSEAHLESPAIEVQAALQAALADWMGAPRSWRHAVVHRWRYANANRPAYASLAAAGADAADQGDHCWWDAPLGLGLCGDALGGGGVEGAWCSARALTALVARSLPADASPIETDSASFVRTLRLP